MTDKKKDKPFVFVRCLTYNHEKYIEDALKGFVMQKTDFPFLAVVIDDCSTDGTADIVRRYEAQYPDIIKGIYLPHNFRSRGEDKRPYYQEYIDKATYWAECEGDDYWTDPYKLQKQVDFMEAHPECSVTFHRFKIFQVEQGKWRTDNLEKFSFDETPTEITVSMFFKIWCTQPLTMMFRRSAFDESVKKKYKNFWDTYQIYHLLCNGKGYLLPFVGGVYQVHQKGMSGGHTTDAQCGEFELISANELFKNNGQDHDVYVYWQETVLWLWNIYNKSGDKVKLRSFIRKELQNFTIPMIRVILIQLKRIIKHSIK